MTMTVAQLRKVLADLDPDTVIWVDLGDGTISPGQGVTLYAASDDRGPCLVLAVDSQRRPFPPG